MTAPDSSYAKATEQSSLRS